MYMSDTYTYLKYKGITGISTIENWDVPIDVPTLGREGYPIPKFPENFFQPAAPGTRLVWYLPVRGREILQRDKYTVFGAFYDYIIQFYIIFNLYCDI